MEKEKELKHLSDNELKDVVGGIVQCSNNTTKESCEAAGCVWNEKPGKCLEDRITNA